MSKINIYLFNATFKPNYTKAIPGILSIIGISVSLIYKGDDKNLK